MSQSQIRDFYNTQNVLITGGTGFLGKVLIERLLRTTNTAQIFVLIRTKKGKNAQTRLYDMLDSLYYNKVKTENPNFKSRVSAIEGDCVSDNLGLSLQDREKLVTKVNVVFHVAATVHLNENIKTAYKINIGGTENLLKLCQKMKNLKSVIHVSTAFSNCHLDTIDEVFYTYPLGYDEVKILLQDLTPNQAEKLSEKMLEGWPNSYAFTKALTEAMIASEAKNLPIGVFRPAIVTSTYKDPIENWSDSYGGPNSILAGAGLGFLRLFPCDTRSYMEAVPVDLTIAALIAIAWDVYKKDKTEIPVYNYVSSIDNPITYYEFFHLNTIHFPYYPLTKAKWAPKFRTMKKSLSYHVLAIFYHHIPALILDFFQVVRFQRPEMLSRIRKVHALFDLFSFYSEKGWKYSNKNVKLLWERMNESDRKLYNFDISSVQWTYYLRYYYKGLRVYLFEDDLSNLAEAKKKMRRFEFLHNLMLFGIYFLGMNLIWVIFSRIYSP
ncbi:fatty acyl-CoA reductase wat-like [Tribolium madens]|uniref:fatty acyl-CoA reductase wat-like n=1 Tax=Tribolium madens TaxID=41895 RepID=UPI001CF7252F|nr:fatty acyl-CoA reductase wat-like [Tribolium madens]